MLLNAISESPDARLSDLEGMLIQADEQQLETEEKQQQDTLLWKLKHIERKSIAVSLPQ
jgi:hypothetical protein